MNGKFFVLKFKTKNKNRFLTYLRLKSKDDKNFFFFIRIEEKQKSKKGCLPTKISSINFCLLR
jgi:hypothetical protein